MLYAGVSWSITGYEVEVVDRDGRRVIAPARFTAAETERMIGHLLSLDRPLVTVVDSTNGVVDGRMMAAGLDMYRADHAALPPRPLFGSVPASDLARVAQSDRAAVTRLERARGTQTGRENELEAWYADSATAVDALTAAGRCVSHGDRHRREIALTFDDGPLRPFTAQILDCLERYSAKATFFCVGANTRPHGEDIARMHEQGHAIGNHTWSHPFLPELTRPQLMEQIDRTQEAIAEASGGAVPTLFRPPYGSRTPEVMGWLSDLPSTVVLWDVYPVDWTSPGVDAITGTILGEARSGSVVLLHDGGGDRSQTVAALPAIIEGLLNRGFELVTVDDMCRTGVR